MESYDSLENSVGVLQHYHNIRFNLLTENDENIQFTDPFLLNEYRLNRISSVIYKQFRDLIRDFEGHIIDEGKLIYCLKLIMPLLADPLMVHASSLGLEEIKIAITKYCNINL